MSRPFRTSPIFVLVAIVVVAWLAATQLPSLVQKYHEAREISPVWGYVYLAILAAAILSTMALAGWALWRLVGAGRAKRLRRQEQGRPASQMSLADRLSETQLHLDDVGRLADDPTLSADVRTALRQALDDLSAKRVGKKLEIVAFGTVSSGKSSLLNALAGRDVFRTDPVGGTTVTRSELDWPGADHVVLVDTPGLAEVKGIDREITARSAARDADVVLLVVDGPLKDFEHKLLGDLIGMEKRVIVCLNKADWFTEADRRRLVDQLAEQAGGIVPAADIVAVRANPVARTRVRVAADGREIEESVQEEGDISALAERILQTVSRDGGDLLAANLLFRARGLAADARQRIGSALDRQADEIVQRAMWQAAAAAALSPLPVIDVAAGLAVTTGMVVSLARVYRQAIDLDTISRLIGELGKNLVAILGLSAAAPAVSSAVASVLKTAPGVGTLAGGALQGLVQALVTRWIGRVFMVYFRGEMQEPPLGWTALARQQWNDVTRPKELVQLVKTGLSRLGGRR
jgi:uncharacterized protein